MSRFVIVTLFPKELNDLINPIREHFESSVSAIIPPHVTLLFPFRAGEITALEEEIQTAITGMSSFQASIGGVKFFPRVDGQKVIYFSLEPESKFKEIYTTLKDRLQQKIALETDTYPGNILPDYVPHITVDLFGTDDAIAFTVLNSEKITGKEVLFDKIALLSNEKSGQIWRLERVFYL